MTAPSQPGATAPDHRMTRRHTLPYLCGTYVAVNAVRDALLVVDGPYCVVDKLDIHGSHDLASTLLAPGRDARVLFTVLRADVEEVKGLVLDRTAQVEAVFEDVCAHSDAGVILTTSFDFHQVLNLPLKRIAARYRKETGRTLLHVPSRSIRSDWLAGYADVCTTLAKEIPLADAAPQPRRVALVGYFMDRLEKDHEGNLAELRRIFAALGLDLAPVWLSGTPYAALGEVADAAAVVALPYAGEAAAILADRLGVPLVAAPLPIGLAGTRAFVERIADHFGVAAAADRFLAEETAAAVRDTVEFVERFLAGGTVSLDLDPYLLDATVSFCEDVGLRVVRAHARSTLADLPDEERARFEAAEAAAVDDPAAAGEGGDGAHFEIAAFGGPIAPAAGDGSARPVPVPFGYPNYFFHPVVARPFVGFGGFRHLVDRLVTAYLTVHGLGG